MKINSVVTTILYAEENKIKQNKKLHMPQSWNKERTKRILKEHLRY